MKKHRRKKLGPFLVDVSSEQAHYVFWYVSRDGKRVSRNYAFRYQAVDKARKLFNSFNKAKVSV